MNKEGGDMSGKLSMFSVVSSIMVGILYFSMVTLFILVPAGENPVIDHHEQKVLLIVGHYLLAFLGFFGMAAVLAISKRLVDNPTDLHVFTKLIALIGFALMAINNFRQAGLDHDLSHEAVMKGGDVLDTVSISWAGLVELSPDGWIDFGGVGLWMFIFSLSTFRNEKFSKKLSILGLIAGSCLMITVLGNVIGFQPFVVAGIGIGGLTVIPLWFIFQGAGLYQLLKSKVDGA